MQSVFAKRIIATLRAHEDELRQAGICRLSLFGSMARGDARQESDVDLAVEFYPGAKIGMFRLTAIERRLAEILGCAVDLLPEPVERASLQYRSGAAACLISAIRRLA
jgi:uncharacterized protein